MSSANVNNSLLCDLQIEAYVNFVIKVITRPIEAEMFQVFTQSIFFLTLAFFESSNHSNVQVRYKAEHTRKLYCIL